MSGMARSGAGLAAYGDVNHGVPNSAANSSGPSMGASSLVTDANSSLSGGGPQLQRSSSINNESYMHLPASPMSFSSNISGSSVMDGSSIVQSPQQEQMPKQGASSTMSQSMMQDTGLLPPHKRPRMDMRQGNYQQQVIQQMLQRHQIPQLQAMIQQQRPPQQFQQHQILQSVPQLQRMQMHQQPQTPRSSPLQLVSPVSSPFESGLCARRLMQYMFHLSNRPPDNSISYWRKFVAEYFAPRAKKRWCLSLYSSAGNHALGAFPQSAMDAWQCGICGSKPGKGFEATYEVLPRLNQVNFDNGVIDELLYLEMPREGKLPSGMMVLEYAKAVQESVHEQLRVVREGHLRIIFTTDLKILSWEFCARRHEELLPRRMLVHQVNQLLQVAQKYQGAINENGSSGVPVQDLQTICNMFVAAGRQMARNLDLQSLNDLGFSKRYVRCLQISEVVNSMKDLIDFSWSHKMGPIESLKNYPQDAAKLQAQKIKLEQVEAAQNLPSDQNTLNRLMAMHPGRRLSAPTTCFPNNFSQGTGQLNNYQYLLRNNPNSGHSSLIHSDAPFTGVNQIQPVPFQGNGPSSVASQAFHDMSIKNQQQTSYGNLPMSNNNDPPSQANQHLQQHMIQQLLQEMVNKGAPQQSNSALIVKDNVKAEMVGGVGSSAAVAKGSGQVQNVSGNSKGEIPGEIKRVMPSADSSKPDATKNNYFSSSKSDDAKQDLLEQLNLSDLDMLQEFADGIQW